MHGQHREERRQKWHMQRGSSQHLQTRSESNPGCVNYFVKAGRRIAVGDCAFFRADNAPLFIGLIRELSAEEGCSLKLSVNLLYRHGDINLGKGASLDAAPNEIFYSFNRDEISAASVLHPCKVSFLRKGVELPSGVSSFICRRVYDTANKCLYWLTDRDYTDEHQAEVDQLLGGKKLEMQAAAESEGSSQRAARSPSPLKPETVNASISTQGKGKKRPRADQNHDSSKREKLEKVEASDRKRDCTLNYEDFANVAYKHEGITTLLFTEQLFQAMLQERSDNLRKSVTLMSHRTSLATIIAATEKDDYLIHFVQLGGLHIINDWLEEVHNGQLGDGSFNEGDTALQEFLLTLIRALEKLPVDLDALKHCNVGKSVNKLRSHRSSEIRQKARKLVGMWKKRVNAEMKSSDEAKSGANTVTSWPTGPVMDTHNAKLQSSKSSAYVKPASNGSNQVGDTKANPQTTGSHKVHAGLTVSKEKSAKAHAGGTSDVQPVVKEEKSCSSSQSQSTSQSWCSGSGKGIVSMKEDLKNISAAQAGTKPSGIMPSNHGDSSKSHSAVTYSGLQKDIVGRHKVKEDLKNISVAQAGTKTSGIMPSNHGDSSKNHSAVTYPGLQKDIVGRHKVPVVERTSSVSLLEKRASDGVRVENTNSQRLIVRLPNPARSPSHSVSTGSIVNGNAAHNSRGSPPGSMGRHDHVNESKIVANALDTSGDSKSVICNGICKAYIKEDHIRSHCAKNENPCKHVSSEHRPQDLVCHRPSVGQEVMANKASVSTNVSPASRVLDSVDGGINLLASVAACKVLENEKSFSGSTVCEGQPVSAHSNVHLDSTQLKGEKQSQGASATCHLELDADCHKDADPVPKMDYLAVDSPKFEPNHLHEDSVSHGSSLARASVASDSEAVCGEAPISDSCGGDHTLIVTTEGNKHLSAGGPSVAECLTRSQPSSPNDTSSSPTDWEHGERTAPDTASLAIRPSTCADAEESLECYEDDALELARQVAKEIEEEVERLEAQECNDKLCHDEAMGDAKPNQTLPVGDDIPSVEYCSGIRVAPDIASMGTCAGGVPATEQNTSLTSNVWEVDQLPSKDEGKMRQREEPKIDTIADANDVGDLRENDPSMEVGGETAPSVDVVSTERDLSVASKSPSLPEDNVCGGKETERPVFDLNEGLIADEMPQAACASHSILRAPIPALSSPDLPPFSGVIQTSSLAAPITVVTASKGAFIPPSSLTITKGELGWKGSAATSAFRPAEPRRVAEASHPPLDPVAATCGSSDVPRQSEKQTRFLDIDLNVADERLTENLCTVSRPLAHDAPISGSKPSRASRPELDLNRLDGNDENICHAISVPRDSLIAPVRSLAPSQTASRVLLDFDLNDGPGVEEIEGEEVSSHRSYPFISGMAAVSNRIQQNADICNATPWYSASSFMPAAMVSSAAMAMPAFPVGRSESSYPDVAATHGSKPVMNVGHTPSPCSTDLYQGVAISSSAVSYSASMPTPFSYAGYPFGAGFPYGSNSYSMGSLPPLATSSSIPFLTGNPSQFVSSNAAVPPYGRPYLMGSIRDITGTEFNGSWARPSLDLNSGPDLGMESDARDGGRHDVSLNQLSYQQAADVLGGSIKRKEPEGGYDPFRSSFKQMAWR